MGRKMKMSEEHFKTLYKAIKPLMKEIPWEHRENGMTPVLWRWSLLWAWPGRHQWIEEVYEYCHDDHIDTALRRITESTTNGTRTKALFPKRFKDLEIGAVFFMIDPAGNLIDDYPLRKESASRFWTLDRDGMNVNLIEIGENIKVEEQLQ